MVADAVEQAIRRKDQPQQGTVLARLARQPETTSVLMLGLVLGFLSIANPTFRSLENVACVLHSIAAIAIAAMGVLLLIVSGTIDLSSGAQMAFGAGVTGAIIGRYPGTPDAMIALGALMAGAVFGLFNWLMCARFKLNPFIATLATSYVGRGMSGLVSSKLILPVIGGLRRVLAFLGALDLEGVPPKGFPPGLTYIGRGSFLGLPILVWIMFGLMLAWHWVLTRTQYGRWLFSVGGNEAAARLSGVPVDAVRLSTHVLAGMMCALGGFLYSIRMGSPSAGSGYEMEIIAGTIIGGVSMDGGTGTVVGAVLGTTLMAFIRNGLVLLKIGALWWQFIIALLTVLAILLDALRRSRE